jgi:DNA-binding response OmpR family regulator
MVDGRSIDLTHQEFALLRYLAQHRGRVFTRDQLLSRVWGVDYYGGSRTVDIHVRRLRMKLGAASKPIQTVRGVGYKMKAP